MYRITNQSELHMAYWLLRYYRSLDVSKLSGADLFDEHVKEVKREIRRYTHAPVCENVLLEDWGIDGYTVLEPLPAHIANLGDAEAYFANNLFIPETNSMYDCTGRPFTVWHKIICRNGRYWCYHHVAFDV